MNWVRSIATIALCIYLASCGGGGSNVNSSSPNTMAETNAHGSITLSDYMSRRDTLASQYRSAKTFQNQYGLGMINADVALANLNLKRGASAADAPGSGVIVGLIDTGIDKNSPALDSNLVTEIFEGSARDETPLTFQNVRSYSHGTAVASVIGSQKSNSVWINRGYPRIIQGNHFHGVAWGANIVMTAIPIGTAGSKYTAISLTSLASDNSYWSGVFSRVLRNNLDFLNLSFGADGNIEAYTETQIRNSFSNLITTMAQAGSSQKTVFVWAAGNAGSARYTSCVANGLPNACINNRPNVKSPEIFSGMMSLISELQGHSIAVVSVGSNGEISSFSNRCGIAAKWCIAAPGSDVNIVVYGPAESQTVPGTVDRVFSRRGHARSSGTSFAAPFVTGGLALMKDVFRGQLSNTQLVTRLFATANKRGRYASRAIYGQGLMDLGAATSIVGNPVITLGASVDSGGFALADTSMQLGLSFGDALHRSLNGQEVMALDQLQAPFWFSLSDFVNPTFASLNELRRSVQSSLIENQVHVQSNDFGERTWKFTPLLPDYHAGKHDDSNTEAQFGQMHFTGGSSSSHLGLANGSLAASFQSFLNTAISVFTTADNKSRGLPVTGLTMSYTPSLRVPAYMTLGAISEGESILRSKSFGAFGSVAANSLFFGTGTSAEVGGWRVSGEAELGVFNPRVTGGMIKKMSPLTTSAFTIQARRQIDSDKLLTLDVSQKLRVESGRAKMSVPVARTHEGSVTYSNRNVELIPSGRQVDFSIRWDHSLNRNGRLSLESAIIKDPGHIRGAKPEGRIIATWHQRF